MAYNRSLIYRVSVFSGYLPVLSLMSAIILNFTAIMGMGRVISIDFVSCILIFWLLRYPAMLHNHTILLVGIFMDSLAGTPIGFYPLLWLSMRMVIGYVSELYNNYGLVHSWIWFVILSFIYQLLQWVFISILQHNFMPVYDGILLWMGAALSYPIIHIILVRFGSLSLFKMERRRKSRERI